MVKHKSTKPNPEAVAAVATRFLYWLARREARKRAAWHRGRGHTASIKV